MVHGPRAPLLGVPWKVRDSSSKISQAGNLLPSWRRRKLHRGSHQKYDHIIGTWRFPKSCTPKSSMDNHDSVLKQPPWRGQVNESCISWGTKNTWGPWSSRSWFMMGTKEDIAGYRPPRKAGTRYLLVYWWNISWWYALRTIMEMKSILDMHTN